MRSEVAVLTWLLETAQKSPAMAEHGHVHVPLRRAEVEALLELLRESRSEPEG
jgi:hypothetical protein